MQNLETNITGGFFLAAAAMLYFGWILLPAKIGSYFEIKDFAAVRLKRRLWIWLYRIYLFGYVAGVMAFVALATLVTESAARILVWPAVVVLDAGLVMTALAYAFYYHFGAWGSMDIWKVNPTMKSRSSLPNFVSVPSTLRAGYASAKFSSV
jgi:hypothetical protein